MFHLEKEKSLEMNKKKGENASNYINYLSFYTLRLENIFEKKKKRFFFLA
jgi:hypothetical protein